MPHFEARRGKQRLLIGLDSSVSWLVNTVFWLVSHISWLVRSVTWHVSPFSYLLDTLHSYCSSGQAHWHWSRPPTPPPPPLLFTVVNRKQFSQTRVRGEKEGGKREGGGREEGEREERRVRKGGRGTVCTEC